MATVQHSDAEDPRLTVRLERAPDGTPRVTERDGQRHYAVVFEVENAPPDTYAATFELDPSYYDPVRTVTPDGEGRVRLHITTYGDYPVLVRLSRYKGPSVVLKEMVSRALRRGLEEPSTGTPTTGPAITRALEDISAH